MTIGVQRVRLTKKVLGGVEYPYAEFSISQTDARDGFVLEVLVESVGALATTVNLLNLMGEEDVSAEIAGNTFFDVNAAADGSHYLGDLTMDFTVLKKNKVQMRGGAIIGAVSLPVLLYPVFGLLFRDADLRVIEVKVTSKANRTGG